MAIAILTFPAVTATVVTVVTSSLEGALFSTSPSEPGDPGMWMWGGRGGGNVFGFFNCPAP